MEVPWAGPSSSSSACAAGISLDFSVMSTWASISAVPDDSGITVRNLLGRRHIAWGEIRDVTFDDGDPWATLHLHDTETVAVMAIQRADGASSRHEAQRLAQLIAASRARP